MKTLTALLLLVCSLPVAAEPRFRLPTAAERNAADIASWATVIAAVALDTKASADGHCSPVAHGDHADQIVRCFELQALRTGVTYGLVGLAKWLLPRDRPCAPACGIDGADQSFFSGHTAIGFSTIGGPRLAFSVPLAIGTGGLRVAAGKHWISDVLVGAGVGLVTSRIR